MPNIEAVFHNHYIIIYYYTKNQCYKAFSIKKINTSLISYKCGNS